MEKGTLSINSENILPIIKKWLYSDKDIFIRELISNASDAITKFKKLSTIGEVEIPENEAFRIDVVMDKQSKTIKVIDNGIGMTAAEIKEYITQIAFSGAEAFLTEYKDKMDKDSEIIGHFGLGFYSAFMVASTVEIETLSYKEGASAAKWTCDGGIEYEMSESDKSSRGTVITLHISDDGTEFLDEWKLKEILQKYCSFMPYEIYFTNVKTENEKDTTADDTIDTDIADSEIDNAEDDASDIDDIIDQDSDLDGIIEEDSDLDDIIDEDSDLDEIIDEDLSDEDFNEDDLDTEDNTKKETPINDTNPLWLKQPKDCTDEEYKEFYRKVFMDFNEPLFWIHLNMDYPVRLKGILYFPKLKNEFETMEGQVKLYNNQVYVADNIKEVIPEFLLLLKGVLDCPDLPLNVSRSFLQNDGYAAKMSGYIAKKVADKLNSLYKNEKESFEKFWDDINIFIKYGCLKEKNFYDKVKEIVLYKTTEGDYVTLTQYLERNKEKHEKKVFYVTDENQQAQYVKMFKDNQMEAVKATTTIDTPFISYLESQEKGVTFARIDADLSDSLKDTTAKTDEAQREEIEKLFREVLKNEKLKVDLQSLKSESVSGVILLSEQSRRMQDMSKMFGGMDMSMFGGFETETTLVLNANNNLVKNMFTLLTNTERKDDVTLIAEHIYDLALMSHKTLGPDAMTKFIERSNTILFRLSK